MAAVLCEHHLVQVVSIACLQMFVDASPLARYVGPSLATEVGVCRFRFFHLRHYERREREKKEFQFKF